jgi:hypothetical protein
MTFLFRMPPGGKLVGLPPHGVATRKVNSVPETLVSKLPNAEEEPLGADMDFHEPVVVV